MMPVNELDHFRPLQIHTWTDSPQLIKVQNKLFDEIFTRRERIWKKALLVIIADLYKCYLQDPTKYLGVQFANKSYKKTRYNKAGFGHNAVVNVVKALKLHSYIKFHIGFFDRNTKVRKMSKMRALPKLIELIESFTDDGSSQPVPAHMIYRTPNEELVILKKRVGFKKRIPINYKETEETTAMRDVLIKYNELLERTYIDIDLRGYEPPDGKELRIDTTNKRVRRIFSNESFEQGGRFYGGWWQNIPKDLRKRIVIEDNSRTVIERDFKAIHINLLYNKAGIDYFAEYGEDADPYTLDHMIELKGTLEFDKWRNFYKKLLLVCINKKREKEVPCVILDEINNSESDDEYPVLSEEDVERAIEAFEERHAPIRSYFYSGIGLKLQKVDSIIAERVIKHFIEEYLPVLCVHDSFIIDNRDTQILDNIVESCMQEVINELGDEWSKIRCTITPRSKDHDIRADERLARQQSDSPFTEINLHEIVDWSNKYGSNERRIEDWRLNKAQHIVIYKPELANTTEPPN